MFLPIFARQAHHLKHLKLLVNENAPTILTAMGATGTISTAYLTGRATFKAADIIRDEEVKRLQAIMTDIPSQSMEPQGTMAPITTKEKIKVVWPVYIPPVASGVLTITSIVMANRISSKRIAALIASSAISERALQEYKTKIVDKFTEKQSQAVRDEIAQDRVTANPPGQVIITGKGDVLCMDMLTGRYFKASVEEIRRAENMLNRELVNFMTASLSSFYDELGLAPTTYTDSVGWNANTMVEVLLSTTMSSDGQPCITLDFSKMPFTDYQNLHD